jgi:steroid delta-isomerase-like uncharacterized protein
MVMSKWQRAVVGAALAAVVGGLTVAVSAADAQPASALSADHQSATNKRVVQAFIKDVLNGHRGDHAGGYFTADMQWHGGTVGTVAGRENVAGLLTGVVTAIPDLHAAVQDIFAEGDKVVVRVVVTGTQQGPILGVPASGRHVQWDAIDVYHLQRGKISEEWAAEDFTAFLNDTGTYKAPWIP